MSSRLGTGRLRFRFCIQGKNFTINATVLIDLLKLLFPELASDFVAQGCLANGVFDVFSSTDFFAHFQDINSFSFTIFNTTQHIIFPFGLTPITYFSLILDFARSTYIMSTVSLTISLAAMCLVSGIQAHVVMNTPESYGLHEGTPLLQVNPLDGVTYKHPRSTDNFHHNGLTVMEAGNVTNVNFTGGAQHGGGSCQFSITYDTPDNGQLNEKTRFKTIYTIIGCCPAQFTNEMANLPAPYHDAEQRLDTEHCGNDTEFNGMRNFLVPLAEVVCIMELIAETMVLTIFIT